MTGSDVTLLLLVDQTLKQKSVSASPWAMEQRRTEASDVEFVPDLAISGATYC